MMSTVITELIGLHRRELMRDRRYFWFALLFPFGMMAIFLALSAFIPKTAGAPDFAQLVTPMALFLAVTSMALTVTSGSLAGMRSKGTLRLLGTTPVGRGRLVLTHMAVRILMCAAQAVALLAVAVVAAGLDPARIPALLGVTLLGMTMFGALGYLIGGRVSSPDAASNICTLIQLFTLFLSGLAFPFALMPEAVVRVLALLPTTFFADLLLSQMPGGTPYHPVWLAIVVVTATALLVGAAAVKLFKWDQREGR
ncbi:ABC transporter permease [Nonomuraea typhae]|uniref:ABC transporter permease n=1 Tax=Nonomuraea typhae TaxID=2603600 RepID=A0ABW7YUX3_9ACTN